LRIEAYFQQIQDILADCRFLLSSTVTYDKRSTYEGFISGELHFTDGSILHVREFVDVEVTVDRLMYVYQYMDAARTLVFRYDNTGHHKKLNLPTFPHHKHEGSESDVVASSVPDLMAVFCEIESLIHLP